MERCKLGDFIELNYGKSLPERKRIAGEYPVIGSGGITGIHNQYLCKAPGIIIGRKGSIGTVRYEKKNFFPIDTVFYVTLKNKEYSFKYFYYLLTQINLKELNTDAAVPGLNREVALSQNISFQSNIKTQQKIANILSNYDNLIENNNKRIKILEEMAQKIYKQWFVDFKFPNHKSATFKDSELGKIPSDWSVESIGTIANVIMGQSPKSCFYNDNKEGLPFHQGVTNFGKKYPTHKTYCACSGRLANINDILVSVRAPVGRINVANDKIIIGRGLAALHSKKCTQLFLFYSLLKLFEVEDRYGSGAVFNAITKDDLLSLDVIVPCVDLIAKFEQIIKPIDKLLSDLIFKNETLKQTRDMLLPRLISGEINVENLEIF